MYNKLLLFLIVFLIGFSFGHSYSAKTNQGTNLQVEKNPASAFILEVYDKIKENYWDNISDAQLLDLFKQSLSKNAEAPIVVKIESMEQLIKVTLDTTKHMTEDKRNKFITSLVGTVLASLNPPNRSGLFTTIQEAQLKNTVSNINPEKDLYKDLGVSKNASDAAIQQAYQKKSEQLAQDKSTEGQQKIKVIDYANNILTQKDQKAQYDQKGIEPTIFAKILSKGVLYLQFKRFSPASYDEFTKTFDSYKGSTDLTSLILDLRGNIGGEIDSSAYFLGNFIGKNQNAFDFYHKGEYLPFKTPTDKLPSISKYKQVVILVDNQTQSSAEIMTASIKKYHAGVVIGAPTKGWGTVERVFPIDNQFDKTQKYSLFLVHSITLRDDNQPIEGRGVDPDVNIKSTDWEQQLFSYFRNSDLIEAVNSVK